MHKKEWHNSSYILLELSTLCKQLVSVSFSQVNVSCLPESKHNSVQSIYILSPMVLQNLNFWTFYLFERGVTVGPCSCQTLWEALCPRFYLRTVSRFMKSLTLIKTLVSALSAILHWHCFSLFIFRRCLNPPSHRQTFIGRFRRNMDSSQNAYNEDTSALVERLDTLEKALFRSGQSGLNSFQSWEKGQASQITASALVLNYRKRKITDMQQWYRRWQGRLYCTNTDSKGRRKCLSLRGRACVKRCDSLS